MDGFLLVVFPVFFVGRKKPSVNEINMLALGQHVGFHGETE